MGLSSDAAKLRDRSPFSRRDRAGGQIATVNSVGMPHGGCHGLSGIKILRRTAGARNPEACEGERAACRSAAAVADHRTDRRNRRLELKMERAAEDTLHKQVRIPARFRKAHPGSAGSPELPYPSPDPS